MTLPSSGPISINDIAAEFGLPSNSVFPTAFYGLGGAPSSGPLSFSDFYGRSASSISASKTFLNAAGFLASDSSTITVVGGTIASCVLLSGAENARVSKPSIGSSTGYLSVTTPNSGNGIIGNVYRITDTNGNFVDISVNASWGVD